MDPEPPSLFFSAIALPELLGFGGILVLLFCSALISGAEIAFFSLAESDLETQDGPDRSKRMEAVAQLLDTPKRLLATILIVNNLINIAIDFLTEGFVFYGLCSETQPRCGRAKIMAHPRKKHRPF